MEPLDDLKNNWNSKSTGLSDAAGIDRSSFFEIIRNGANREKNQVVQYFWAGLVYQIILYALLCFTLFKNFGNRSMVIAVTIGLCVNIPFTWTMVSRFRIMYGQSLSRLIPAYSLKNNLELYFTRLSAFFRFKRIADGIIIPVNAFLIVYILFEWFAAEGAVQHLLSGLILFLAIWLACGIAVHLENKNRFRKPMRRIQALLREFDTVDNGIAVTVTN